MKPETNNGDTGDHYVQSWRHNLVTMQFLSFLVSFAHLECGAAPFF